MHNPVSNVTVQSGICQVHRLSYSVPPVLTITTYNNKQHCC